MIQSTVERLGNLVPSDRVLVVTGAALVDDVWNQLPQLPSASIVGEPCRRDTAPCIGLAALLIERADPEGIMAVMPSDHVISPDAAFQEAIELAARLVEETPQPDRHFRHPPDVPGRVVRLHRARRAAGRARPSPPRRSPAVYQRQTVPRESPRRTWPREYLEAGTFYWNSGIFVWRAATILAAMEERQPEMMVPAAGHRRGHRRPRLSRRCWPASSRRSRAYPIDYAVMEHARDVVVIEAPFTWDDVGSWQSIARLQGVDDDGNTISARHVGLAHDRHDRAAGRTII